MGTHSYKLIAIDLDGTLLSPTGEVTPRAKAAVHGCLSAGMLVVFATGRHWIESRTVLEAIEHYDSAVLVGGAIVMDTKQQVTLHRTLMDPQLARDLSSVIERLGHAVLATQDHAAAGCDYVLSADVPADPETWRWMESCGSKVKRVSKLADFDHAHTIRISVVAVANELSRVEDAINAQFGERIFYHRIVVSHAGRDLIEIFDPSVNKWEGILAVAKKHGIEPHQVIAIGDDMNDVHMIQHAGLGVAMGNARPEIKAIAKRVIGANHDEGLAEFLEELVETRAVETGTEADREDAAA